MTRQLRPEDPSRDAKSAERRLGLQIEVGRIISEAETLEQAALPILRLLCEGLSWDVGELWSLDPDEQVPYRSQLWASSAVDLTGLETHSRSRGLPPAAGRPWKSGCPVWISDVAADELLAHEPEATKLGLHGMFCQPVVVCGEVAALLRVFSREIRQEDGATVEFMASVGGQIAQFMGRQRDQDELRESEARKAAFIEAALDAVITVDQHGAVVETNPAFETIFGHGRADAVGRPLVELIVSPWMRSQVQEAFANHSSQGRIGLLGKRLDGIAMKADGSEFAIEFAIAAIGEGDRPLLTIYVCDVSKRKEAEEAVRRYKKRLRSMTADLLMAEEQERRSLARDLHDALSQTLALTRMKLSALKSSMRGELDEELAEIDGLIQQADKASRSISFELSPPVLHDLGLGPALQWLVENIQSRYGLEIVLEDDGQPKTVRLKTRVILFRSIRELLINAAKHAAARRVHLSLEREADCLSAAIEDDGIGMDPNVAAMRGSGLFSIEERLAHIGGSMCIESTPGQGTRIHLRVPLTRRSRKVRVGP